MIEIIAFLETGHFKYNKINSEYINAIFDKFCIGNKIDYKEQHDFCIEILGDMFEKISEVCTQDISFKAAFGSRNYIGLVNILFVETITEGYNLTFKETSDVNFRKYTAVALYEKNKLNLSDQKIIEFIKNQIIYFIDKYSLEFYYYMKSVTTTITDVLNIEICSL